MKLTLNDLGGYFSKMMGERLILKNLNKVLARMENIAVEIWTSVDQNSVIYK